MIGSAAKRIVSQLRSAGVFHEEVRKEVQIDAQNAESVFEALQGWYEVGQKRTAGRFPVLKLIRTVLQGTVPRKVWRARMRCCQTCPLFRKELHLCKSTHRSFLGLGCHCSVFTIALFPNPNGAGCFGNTHVPGRIGWPAYKMGFLERVWSPIRFLLRR